MKKLIKIIYLIFTAFLFACTSLTDGNRNFVDNQTTFVVGKNSKIGGSIVSSILSNKEAPKIEIKHL